MIVVQVNLKTLERKVLEEHAHPRDITDDALAMMIAKLTMAKDRKTNLLQRKEARHERA